MRVDAANDGGSFTNNAWTAISDDPHTLDPEWRAATASENNDGVLNLWVDELQANRLANIDNETRRVDYVQLGAVNALDNDTRGPQATLTPVDGKPPEGNVRTLNDTYSKVN